MAGYKLTVRDGPKVVRDDFDSLDAALEALRERAERIRAEGGLPEVKTLRTYGPEQRVKARIELTSGGTLRRGRTAGVDVMGDGAIVPFAGGVVRKPLDVREGAGPYDAVAEAMGR
jgi:hypothetical protein